MPSASKYNPDVLNRMVEAVDFRSASVTFSCKVSVKDGDIYRGVESGITVSLRLNGLEGMPDEVVRLAALKHMPMMAAKVYTDLAVGDVLDVEEARARIAKAKEFYESAYQRVLHGGSVGTGGVSDAGHADGGDTTGLGGRPGASAGGPSGDAPAV